MKVKIDKMPTKPQECLFYRYEYPGGYFCKLRARDMICDPKNCTSLLVEEDADFEEVPEDELHISYICDRKQECGKNGCGDCSYTSDVNHAANFMKVIRGLHMEKGKTSISIGAKPSKDENVYSPSGYTNAAMRTVDPKLTEDKRLLEGLVGMNSEAGEALDIWKKYKFQGHDLDKWAIALELGDVLWYLTEAAVALGYSLEEIMKMNIKKLQERYPNGFDPEKSRNRKVTEIGDPGTPGWENG